MKFIIIGAGTVGLNLAERLAHTHNDVVLIDESRDAINNIPGELDLQCLHGNGCDPALLASAGLMDADYVISVTDNDEVNTATSLIAKMINPEAKRIARIRELDFEHVAIGQEKLEDVFDLIINPPKVAAEYLAKLLEVPGADEVICFAGGELEVVALEIMPGSELDGKKISTLSELRRRIPVLFNALVRDDKLIVPRGSDRIHAGDLFYCLTFPKYIADLLELAGLHKTSLKNIMIWGDAPIVKNLINILEEQGKNVKLILPSTEGHEAWLEELGSTLVIEGDVSDTHLLVEESIEDVDAFLALSHSDEQNIISALLSKKLGAKFCFALVNNRPYIQILRSIGIDTVVNSQLAAAVEINKHIYSNSLVSATNLLHTDAYFIELHVTEEHKFVDQCIKDLDLPYGILVSAIFRDAKPQIPSGFDQIHAGDRIIIFFIKSAVKELEKFLNLELDLFK